MKYWIGKRALMVGVLIGLTGCTSYQVPDYYSQPKPSYQTGQSYWVKDLRCQKTPEKCRMENKEWVSHREYPKQYYFE